MNSFPLIFYEMYTITILLLLFMIIITHQIISVGSLVPINMKKSTKYAGTIYVHSP